MIEKRSEQGPEKACGISAPVKFGPREQLRRSLAGMSYEQQVAAVTPTRSTSPRAEVQSRPDSPPRTKPVQMQCDLVLDDGSCGVSEAEEPEWAHRSDGETNEELMARLAEAGSILEHWNEDFGAHAIEAVRREFALSLDALGTQIEAVFQEVFAWTESAGRENISRFASSVTSDVLEGSVGVLVDVAIDALPGVNVIWSAIVNGVEIAIERAAVRSDIAVANEGQHVLLSGLQTVSNEVLRDAIATSASWAGQIEGAIRVIEERATLDLVIGDVRITSDRERLLEQVLVATEQGVSDSFSIQAVGNLITDIAEMTGELNRLKVFALEASVGLGRAAREAAGAGQAVLTQLQGEFQRWLSQNPASPGPGPMLLGVPPGEDPLRALPSGDDWT